MHHSSTEFNDLISDSSAFAELMEYNCSPGSSVREWEDKRKFIAQVIPGNGTILDIGCAGGFFLRSLQEWTGFDLIPYGIDINEDFIRKAQELFPACADHFLRMDVRNIAEFPSFGFPDHYDFTYWNFPGNWDVRDAEWTSLIETTLLPMTKKRIIIGFYGSNAFPFDSKEWNDERERIKRRVENLRETGLAVSGTMFNPTQFNQAIAWIDRN
ncbi:MAG TPA: class I SAM-dependent methyltransferase [Candidatus Paceibacterota bacterium]|nr:class I SAM-dependent methyltransferase [Candidatus Paceibacterota bacterium]